MIKKVSALFLVALLLAPEPLKAEYRLIGMGTVSCGAWTAGRRANQAPSAQQWVLGFLSGVGFIGKNMNPLSGVDAETVWSWVDNFCAAKPLSPISDATSAFIEAHPR